jgi:hypothetical protein
VSIYDAACFEFAAQYLETKFTDRGVEPACSLVVGHEKVLRALLLFLELRHCDQPFRPTIRPQISVYGDLLPYRWRERHRCLFGGPVIDRYSLSEAIGGATSYDGGRPWLVDRCVLLEVVDLMTSRPIKHGQGAIVVTALSPYQTTFPLVRYLTGDIGSVVEHDALGFCAAITIDGRLLKSLTCPSDGHLIATHREIIDILDGEPTLQRDACFRDARAVLSPDSIGDIKFEVHRDEQTGATVLAVSQRGAAADAVYHALARHGSSELRAAIADGRVLLRVAASEATPR